MRIQGLYKQIKLKGYLSYILPTIGSLGICAFIYICVESALLYNQLEEAFKSILPIMIFAIVYGYSVIINHIQIKNICLRILKAVGIIVVLILSVTTVYAITSGLKYGWNDSAIEAYKPIDQKLREQGFEVECSYGDSGKGFSNYSPWRTVIYRYTGSYDSALSIINDAAKIQGFRLQPYSETVTTEEFLSDQDKNLGIDLNKRFIDINNPKSIYYPYDDGEMNLYVDIHNQGEVDVPALWCKPNTYTLQSSLDNIVIESHFSLPQFSE